MIAHNDDTTGSVSEELLRQFSEVAQEVAQESNFSQTLARIFKVASLLAGSEFEVVALLDYAFDESFTLENGSEEITCRKLARTGGVNVAPDFVSTFSSINVKPVAQTGRKSGEFTLWVPVVSNSSEIGLLYLVNRKNPIALGSHKVCLFQGLGGLAAVVIDRRRRNRDALRLHEWLDAFGNVFAASQFSGDPEGVSRLLQVIADNAKKISGADFVVLYEYFSDRGDVRLPPTISGSVWKESFIRGRSIALEHRKSLVFKLLDMKGPFFAEDAPGDWANQGLIDGVTCPPEHSFFNREGVASSAGIPLRIDEERVGVLFVNYRSKQVFSPEFKAHLTFFANHAALAIGNTRIFLHERRYSENLEALNRIGSALSSAKARNIREIGQLIDAQTLVVIPTQNFFLCLYQPERDTFSLPYLRDERDTEDDLRPRLAHGLAAFVCRKGEALLANREQQQEIFNANKAQLVGQASAIWLGAPLLVRDKVIGALVVQDYDNADAFNDEHLQLLTAIASQAAIAIDNHRLFRDANLRLQELEALLDISQAFRTGQRTSKELFSSILDHVCEIVDCSGALLLLVDPGSNPLLEAVASSSRLLDHIGKTIAFGEGVSGRVAETGREMIDNNYPNSSNQSTAFPSSPTRVCAIPLSWQGNIIGVMTLSSFEEGVDFSSREIEVLQRFAGPMTAAIQNARDSSLRNALVHAGPYAIVATDSSGKIVTFNEEAASLFGYRENTRVGEQEACLYWDGIKSARRIRKLLRENGKLRNEEIFGRSENGERIPLSLSAALLKDDRGEVMGSVGILQDVSFQSLPGRTKYLVNGIREISREDNMSNIIQAVVLSAVELLYADVGCFFLKEGESFKVYSPFVRDYDLLGQWETAGGQEQIVAWAAEDLRELLVLSGQEQLGNFRLAPTSQSSVLIPIRTDTRLLGLILIESNEPWHSKADQNLIEILAAQAAISISRVQLLRDKEETQRGLLVRANAAAIGQIATSFIHEAKNSLNGMTLTIHNLREDLDSEPDLKAKNDYMERLSVVMSEMHRLDDLSRRLQRFTQQGLRPEKKEVYLNEVVAATLQLLNGVLRKKDMRFTMKLESSLDRPPHGKGVGNPISVDASQIQQALMNLILNAVAASPERSPLLVETRSQGAVVIIRITDKGAGITDEAKRNLFSAFFTTKKDGVGLGLYISRLFVEENHGGKIEIDQTAVGKGTTFSIHIPKLPKAG